MILLTTTKVGRKKKVQERETRLLVLSQLHFPENSRDYLIDLAKEVAALRSVQWVVVAGGVLAGKYLEELLKNALKDIKGKEDKEEYRFQFVEEWAEHLNDFLPVLENDVKYHIVTSPKLDASGAKGVGREILLRLFELRGGDKGDIRLYLDDTEPRMSLQWPTEEEIRVVVPSVTGWYSKHVSTAVQRLVNPFVNRSFTEQPPVLIITGCTGSGVNIPSYKGIPVVSAPACHKINQVKTTESMVGCLVVTLRQNEGRTTYSLDTYDFRPFVSAERRSLVPEDIAIEKKRILLQLSRIGMSFDTLYSRMYGFKMETKSQDKIEDEKGVLQKHLDALLSQGYVVFQPETNRYELTKRIAYYRVKTNLGASLERALRAKVVAYSCVHVGALKTLYSTFAHVIPEAAEDADALINCGDTIQGLSHGYEYNGELVPTLNTYDKQALKAAQIHSHVILNVFDRRYAKLRSSIKNSAELAKRCLILFVYCLGNHDRWVHYQKQGLPLMDFHEKLKSLLIEGVAKRLSNLSYQELEKIVNEKILRVGESELINVNGVGIVVSHPHKGGAETKSMRIQGVIHRHAAKKHPDKFALALVGNFHTAAATHEPVLGRTHFGIMLGAFLKDTQFERYIDKVVEHGPVVATVWVSPKKGLLLRDEVQFLDDIIHPTDRAIVEADTITESMVTKLTKRLVDGYGDSIWR